MFKYELMTKLGSGSYGDVSLARKKGSETLVALKVVKTIDKNEGVPVSVLREASLLKKLSHTNVVHLLEIVHDNAGQPLKIVLVLEYIEQDLRKMINSNKESGLPKHLVRSLSYQLLSGLEYLHQQNVLHRDLKPANLLISSGFELKIADFGLARAQTSLRQYSHEVVTLWYRAPDVLLGSTLYDSSIDLWSVGAIMAEMALCEPLWPGKDSVHQLNLIFKFTGTPTGASWPESRAFPFSHLIQECNVYPGSPLSALVPHQQEELYNLISRLLQLNPRQRLPATEALAHVYFQHTL